MNIEIANKIETTMPYVTAFEEELSMFGCLTALFSTDSKITLYSSTWPSTLIAQNKSPGTYSRLYLLIDFLPFDLRIKVTTQVPKT